MVFLIIIKVYLFMLDYLIGLNNFCYVDVIFKFEVVGNYILCI